MKFCKDANPSAALPWPIESKDDPRAFFDQREEPVWMKVSKKAPVLKMTGYRLDILYMSNLNGEFYDECVQEASRVVPTVVPLGLARNTYGRFAEWACGLRFACFLV
jgi:hypothetical protein